MSFILIDSVSWLYVWGSFVALGARIREEYVIRGTPSTLFRMLKNPGKVTNSGQLRRWSTSVPERTCILVHELKELYITLDEMGACWCGLASLSPRSLMNDSRLQKQRSDDLGLSRQVLKMYSLLVVLGAASFLFILLVKRRPLLGKLIILTDMLVRSSRCPDMCDKLTREI